MAEDNGTTIGFRCTGSWTGRDLVDFTSSISGIYNSFLTSRVRERLEDNYLESIEVAFRRSEKMLGHPFYHEMFHMWREALQYWRKKGASEMPIVFAPPLPFGFQDPSAVLPSDQQIFSSLERYSSHEDQCRVKAIRMASPGGFSFQGIGEIIEQFRELIKDIWWRNSTERAQDQMEIIERYLRLRRENPDLNIPLPTYLRKDDFLAREIERNLNQLKALEERGRLEAVPKNLDYVPLK